MFGLKNNKTCALLDVVGHDERSLETAVFGNVALRIFRFAVLLVLVNLVEPGCVSLDDLRPKVKGK